MADMKNPIKSAALEARSRRDMREVMRNAEADPSKVIVISLADDGSVSAVSTALTATETLGVLAQAQFKVLTDNA